MAAPQGASDLSREGGRDVNTVDWQMGPGRTVPEAPFRDTGSECPLNMGTREDWGVPRCVRSHGGWLRTWWPSLPPCVPPPGILHGTSWGEGQRDRGRMAEPPAAVGAWLCVCLSPGTHRHHRVPRSTGPAGMGGALSQHHPEHSGSADLPPVTAISFLCLWGTSSRPTSPSLGGGALTRPCANP